jgi:hypothetical protein
LQAALTRVRQFAPPVNEEGAARVKKLKLAWEALVERQY